MTHAWQDAAACAGDRDLDAWYAGHSQPDRRAYAVTVCGRCPVQENCGEFAIETDQRFGIWAGVDLTEPLPENLIQLVHKVKEINAN